MPEMPEMPNAPLGEREERGSKAGECRRCQSFCDKLVDPAGCMAIGCRYLYSYEDAFTGGRYMGCLQKVFNAEIDIDAFELAEHASRTGFGGIKMTGEPLPHCQFTVERAYEGEGPEYECVNKRFFDCNHQSPEAVRAFDLRNALRPEL
ncbi:MAG: hypothetical protein ACXWDQ_00985 [Solirubrobacterales bacterium]